MFKSHNEKIVTIIVFVVVSLLFCRKFYVESELKRNGVLILGKFNNRTFSPEPGWVYSYSYRFGNKEYTRKFSGRASRQMQRDSLLFFRILKTNPTICRQLTDILVPPCLRLKDVPENGWKTMPTCK